MTEQRATLIGWIAPPREGPGFVIPALRIGQSNAVLTQTTDANGRITGFHAIDPPTLQAVDATSEATVAQGEPALWGYAFPGKPAQILHRAQLAAWLACQIDVIDDPLAKLQAVEFCELGTQMRDAWRRAYKQLAIQAPPSAMAWRDLVVVPSRARLAVQRAIRDHDLECPSEEIGRSIGVQVVDNQVRLAIEPKLYASLAATPGALEEIERGTAEVREAFELDAHLVAEPRPDLVEQGEVDAALLEPIIVAIGNLAIEALGHLAPNDPARPWRVVRTYERGIGMPVSLLVTHGGRVLHSGDSDLGSIGPLISKFAEGVFARIIFLFAASPADCLSMRRACELAKDLRRERLEVIAAIPHLPMMVQNSAAYWHEAQQEICQAFDSICFISDQSPQTRAAQAFGPARSVRSASERLAMLIARLELEDLELARTGFPQRAFGVAVNVLSSAADRRIGVAPLLEHALARAMDPSLDLHDVDFAAVTASPDLRPDQLEMAHPTLIQAGSRTVDVSVLSQSLSSVPARGIHLHLAGARWILAEKVDFEGYCRSELGRLGWTIELSSGAHCDFLALRQGAAIDVALSPMLSPAFPQGKRGQARAASRDCVLLTQTQVRRSVFAEHLLRGWMPIHISRMRQLAEIFDRRYASLLSALQQPSAKTLDALERAAFRQLQASGQVAMAYQPELGFSAMEWKWTMRRDRQTSTEYLRGAVRIDLPVDRHGRNARGDLQPKVARLVLHRGGWEIADILDA